MTIITLNLHHLCFGHCVNSSVVVLDLGTFFGSAIPLQNTSVHPQFHTMTSKKMVCSLLFTNLMTSIPKMLIETCYHKNSSLAIFEASLNQCEVTKTVWWLYKIITWQFFGNIFFWSGLTKKCFMKNVSKERQETIFQNCACACLVVDIWDQWILNYSMSECEVSRDKFMKFYTISDVQDIRARQDCLQVVFWGMQVHIRYSTPSRHHQ